MNTVTRSTSVVPGHMHFKHLTGIAFVPGLQKSAYFLSLLHILFLIEQLSSISDSTS